MAGSGLFTNQGPVQARLIQGKRGVANEIDDLRRDVARVLAGLAALSVEEFTNPVGLSAPGTAALKAATATVASEVTLLPADLLDAGEAQLALWPRQITFTTAGSTPADAPATAAVTGLDEYGAAQTETVTLAQTAATATSTKYWSAITSIVYPAADGTDATVAVGIAAAVVKEATATVASVVTLTATDIIQNDLANNPRALVFTTAGSTPADAPANCVITGTDANGLAITETLALAQTAAAVTSANYYKTVTSIVYAAADGTDATIAITPSAAIGLSKTAVSRAGMGALVREFVAGALPGTAGALAAPTTTDLPYGSYTPDTAADGANDYAVYYEYDPTA